MLTPETNTNLESSIDRGKFIEARRKDGLTVFFDKDTDPLATALNAIRAHGSRKAVWRAFTILRGLQITRSYMRKHGTEQELAELEQDIDHFLDNEVPKLLASPA